MRPGEFGTDHRLGGRLTAVIGDDDLLQILGQASKPAIIQTHLKKLFAGIHSVNFDPEEKSIITMNSIDGEIVPLKKSIRISSEVFICNFIIELKVCS